MKKAAPVMISLFSQNDESGIIPPHRLSFSKSSPKCLPGASSQGTLLGRSPQEQVQIKPEN
jgi:hypothetical protein